MFQLFTLLTCAGVCMLLTLQQLGRLQNLKIDIIRPTSYTTCAWVHGRDRIFKTIVMILNHGGHGIDFHYTQSSHLGKKTSQYFYF